MTATTRPPAPSSSSTSPRSGFTLTGRSRTLDPRTHAVRADIADVRLADQVFAPHYAAPLRRSLAEATPLREGRDPAATALADLPAGAPFDVLDVTGDVAWGIAVDQNLVGYVDAAAVRAP
ncbi:SH3 domain-containing protein [Sphingomonas sp. BK580]|uniref:SH3 domain-containing protein n=1 Tax=Sphingomonas sp. BK580 TaxID=2586972 RepID=UPI0017DF1E2E|nr:SH3 domain-containing protein [Sphingomonas sp. BK580]MBB3692960.1 hypothetical protein [Sphingomonas sp. BK580]